MASVAQRSISTKVTRRLRSSLAARIFDAEFLESQHGEANAEDLSGAEMAVGDFGFAEISVEGKHFVICNRVIL